MRAPTSTEPFNLLLITAHQGENALLHERLRQALPAGSTVRRVRTPDDGFSSRPQEEFDAVLLDLGHPDAEGIAKIEAASNQFSGSPLVLLSERCNEAVAAKALEAGLEYVTGESASQPLPLALALRRSMERGRMKEALQGALRENSRLTSAMENVTIGVTIVDPHLPGAPIVFANPAFYDITGYAPEEVLGRNCRILQGPQTNRDTVAQLRAALAAQQPFRGTLLNYRKDGSAFWNALTINPTFDPAGGLVNFVGVQRDVTAQIEEQERLRRSEASLALAQRVAHLGSWELELDGDGEVQPESVRWSDETFRIFGHPPGSIAPTQALYHRMVHPDDFERMEALLAQTRHSGHPFSMDHRLVLPDGTQRFVHLDAQVIAGGTKGERAKIAGTIQDITERKKSEEALRESEDRLQIIIENLTEGLIISDLQGNLLHWNQASLRMHDFATRAEGERALQDFGSLFEFRTLDGTLLAFEQWPLPRIIRGEHLSDFEVRIRPQVLEFDEACRGRFEQRHGPVAVGNVGGVHLRTKHQSRAIYEQVTFASVDLFAAIVAVYPAAIRGLGALAVDDRGARLGRAARPASAQSTQATMQALPHPGQTPRTEIMINGLPRRKVGRQQVPGTARAHQVKDGVAD